MTLKRDAVAACGRDAAVAVEIEEQKCAAGQGEDRCRDLLTRNRAALDLITRVLLEQETISGSEVNRLIRVSFGPFQLGELAEGAVEAIEIEQFLKG